VEAKSRAATTEDHELIDPTLSSERLLFRLFNDRGVRVSEAAALQEACRCSAEKIDSMLQSFSAEERRAMIGDDGMIGVTCEFCSVKRVFDPVDYDK
jgi:molecular chaperone Hsp33